MGRGGIPGMDDKDRKAEGEKWSTGDAVGLDRDGEIMG
jgi:hypothetical protein